MKLNRWTILAIILLLSTAVGLLFRPLGDGAEGQQVVEDESLTLTCPESITVVYASQYFVHDCRLDSDPSIPERYRPYVEVDLNVSSMRAYDVVSEGRSGTPIEVAGGKKSSAQLYSARRSYDFPVEAGIRLGPTSRVTLRPPIETTINVRVKFPLPFYIGLGLLILQVGALIAGPILAVSGGILGIVRPIRGALGTHVFSLRSLAFAPFLVAPWWFRARLQEEGRLTTRMLNISFLAVDVMWYTYIVQVILIVIVSTIDLFATDAAVSGASIIPAPFLLIFIVPIALILCGVLFFVRMFTLTERLPRGWADRPLRSSLGLDATTSPPLMPFIGVTATGWFFMPLVFAIYWFGYL